METKRKTRKQKRVCLTINPAASRNAAISPSSIPLPPPPLLPRLSKATLSPVTAEGELVADDGEPGLLEAVPDVL